MGAQSQLFWTLVSFWAWLLCGPGLTAAIPLVTEWQPMEGEDEYTTTEILPWQTDSDYFEPTTVVVAEMPLSGTEGPQTPFPSLLLETEGAPEVPGQNPGSADETSPPSPVEKEAVNLVPNSTKGSTDPATDGPTKSEILPPEETVDDPTEKLVTEEETLVNASSSSSSLLKGTVNITKAVPEETATSPVLLSKGTPSAFLGERPEVTELVTDVYSSGNDPALPTVTSNRNMLATISEEEQMISSSISEGETSLDTATREANMGSGLNPTIRSWEDTTDIILGPNDDTLEPSPDASSEAAPSLSSGTPSSNPEVLPGLIFALPESDAVTTKLIMPSEWPISDLTLTHDTVFESLEPSELVTVSLQPSPEEKADLGVELAPAKGRGDMDSFTASDLDAEPAAIGSSSGPDLSLEGTVEIPILKLEDLIDEEAPDSSSVEGAVDTPSGSASSSNTTSRASATDFEPTPASPVRLSAALDSSSQLLEEGEAGAASETQGETAAAAEEGSGSANSNEESPLASSSLQPNPSASGTEILDKENLTADLDSGAASSSLNSGMETTNSELADAEAATTSDSSSESGTSSSGTTSGAGALPDTETPLPPGLDDEVAAEAQGVSRGTALPTSLPDVPSQSFDLESEGGESSSTGVPGNVGFSEDSTAVTGSDVGSGSAAGQEAATGNEGQSVTDLLPSDPEPGPAYATQQPVEEAEVLPMRESPGQPPVESAESLTPYDSPARESPSPSIPLGDPFAGSSVSEFDETDPSAADRFLASSQPLPESRTDSETSEGTDELEDLEDVKGEEISNVSASQEYESAPAGTGSLTGTNESGDQDSEADLPSQDDLAGNEEPLSSSSRNQDEFSTGPPEAQLGTGDAQETSTSFAGVSDAKSGELVDEEPSLPLLVSSGTSEPAQGPSQETKSSATLVDEPLGPSSLETEDTLGPLSGIFGPSSQSSDPTLWGRDEGGDPELVANNVDVTASSSGEAGNDALFSDTESGLVESAVLPAEQSDTLADGETSGQSSAEEEETSLTNILPGEESPGSVPDPSGEKSSPPYIPDSPGVQPSGSQSGNGASLPSPDSALVLGTATSEESQSASLPTEGVDIPASGSAGSMASQPSPEVAAETGPEREGQMVDPASSTGGEASLIPSAAESQPASPSTEVVDSPASGSADGEASQLSPEDAAETGPGASEREGQMADPASSTGGEASLIPSAAESQSASPSTEVVDSPASGLAGGGASQPSPDGAAGTGPGASEREGQMADPASSTGGEASLIPSAAESQPASSSTEVVDSPASGSAGGGASQTSPDGAASSEPEASEGEGQMAGLSSPTGGEAFLSPSAAESQSASSSIEGMENPGLGSAGGKASLDAAGTASPEDSESEGQMDGASTASWKEIQSPETSASEDVSGKIKAPLSAEGMETAESGPAASGEPISIGTDLSSESAEEQPKENIGGASLPPSSPVDESSKMVHEGVAGASASDSTALDEQLVAGGLSDQVSGITVSSQPLSGSQSVSDDTASADNTGSGGNSDLASGGQTAPSKTSTLGGLESSSETAKAGAEIPAGSLGSGTGLLGGDGASVAEGPKVPAASMGLGTSSAGAESVESSSGKSSKSQEAEETSVGKEADTVSSFPSGAAGKTTGPLPNTLPGSSSKPVADSREGVPGESGEVASSASTSAAHKDSSAASTGGEMQSSLSGAQLNPAESLQVPAGESGPELKAGEALPSSKAGVTGPVVNVPSGKSSSSVPSSSSISGSQTSKPGSSATSSISLLSSKTESLAGDTQGASGSTKASPPNGLDVHGAASGSGLFPANSAQTTSKKPDADPENPKKEKKIASKDRNTSKKSSGEHGLWLYKLTSRIQANYRQRCLDWLSREGRPSVWNKDLPHCPCSLQQARSDNRYTQIKKGLLDSRLTMLYSSTPNKYGAGIRCLYKNNQLVEGHQEKVWKNVRKSSLYNVAELKLYDWCCKQAGSQQLCDKYHQKRPRIGCDGYRSPVQN